MTGTDAHRILVVDDEDLLRAVVVRQLQRLGHTVLDAGDGEFALEVVGTDASIELLIADLRLGGAIDGVTLVERARVLNPALRVVVMTGLADQRLTAHPVAGAHLLRKPFGRDELARAVHAAFDTAD